MDTNFNRLQPGETERLVLLSECLGDINKAISKTLRHGYESTNPEITSQMTNRELLAKELGTLQATMDLLLEGKDLSNLLIMKYRKLKAEKGFGYIHHQPGA